MNNLMFFDVIFLCVFQIAVAGGVSAYQAIRLHNGKRKITSKGGVGSNWRPYQLVFYCFCGIIAGLLGGMLGLGGGFILGPLFLELGIPPQVLYIYMVKSKLAV